MYVCMCLRYRHLCVHVYTCICDIDIYVCMCLRYRHVCVYVYTCICDINIYVCMYLRYRHACMHVYTSIFEPAQDSESSVSRIALVAAVMMCGAGRSCLQS